MTSEFSERVEPRTPKEDWKRQEELYPGLRGEGDFRAVKKTENLSYDIEKKRQTEEIKSPLEKIDKIEREALKLCEKVKAKWTDRPLFPRNEGKSLGASFKDEKTGEIFRIQVSDGRLLSEPDKEKKIILSDWTKPAARKGATGSDPSSYVTFSYRYKEDDHGRKKDYSRFDIEANAVKINFSPRESYSNTSLSPEEKNHYDFSLGVAERYLEKIKKIVEKGK